MMWFQVIKITSIKASRLGGGGWDIKPYHNNPKWKSKIKIKRKKNIPSPPPSPSFLISLISPKNPPPPPPPIFHREKAAYGPAILNSVNNKKSDNTIDYISNVTSILCQIRLTKIHSRRPTYQYYLQNIKTIPAAVQLVGSHQPPFPYRDVRP